MLQGNALTVQALSSSDVYGVSFRAVYSVETTACGGEMTAETGALASPGYPANYPDGVECVWTVGGSPGNKVSLTLTQMDVQDSQGCNRDYLEIHEGGPEGPLLSHLCGSQLPNAPIVGTKLWIKFNSDDGGVGRGFLAEYSLVHGSDLTGDSGVITSPMYPHTYTVPAASETTEPVIWSVTTVPEGTFRILLPSTLRRNTLRFDIFYCKKKLFYVCFF